MALIPPFFSDCVLAIGELGQMESSIGEDQDFCTVNTNQQLGIKKCTKYIWFRTNMFSKVFPTQLSE